ncbi:hypothetical protein FOA52_000835 [Chlamydomonas sp. UWO 241]|nr:hypothetical protein FOA52_000835 [Chlamydomonas sp. UWO 241]
MWKQQEELGWLRRPARRQVDESTIKKEVREDAGERNLWTGKRINAGRGSGGGRPARERSDYRCRPELDIGRTRGSDAKQMQFCLFFAKGCCSQASACVYLHRLPTEEDEAYHKKDMAADIFGKEKRAEAEGYRRGAGTFERDVRTLYVNYEGAGSLELPKLRALMEDNFNTWGPLKRVHISHSKTLAFVEFEWRSSAEFAKEAMHKQGLTGSTQREVLTVRWASEDPNPSAVIASKRSHMDAFEKAAMESWEALPEEQKTARIQQLQMAAALKSGRVISDYPSTDSQYPSTDAQRPHGGDAQHGEDAGDGGEGYPSTDGQYPDTDAQYASTSGGAQQLDGGDDFGQMSAEEYTAYCQQYYAQYGYPSAQETGEKAAALGAGEDGHEGQEAREGAGGDGQAGDGEAGGGHALGLLAGYGSDESEEGEGGEGKEEEVQKEE